MKGKVLFGVIAGTLVFVFAAIAERTDEVRSRPTDEVSHYKVLGKANVPRLINYQGYLTDAGGNPITDTVEMTFSIWDAATGGTQLWNETQSSVTVTNGLFNVLLGSVISMSSTVFTGATLWLQTQVSAEVLQPRKEIASVGYAVRAVMADTADYADEAIHADTADYARNADIPGDGHSLDAADGSPTDAVYVDNAGNVGIGTTSPGYILDVAGMANLNKGKTGRALEVNGDEALWYNGTYFSWGYGGSANYFADNVGIGSTSPRANLHITGGTGIPVPPSPTIVLEAPFAPSGDQAVGLLVAGNTGDFAVSRMTDGGGTLVHTDLMVEASTGNVGIGTTSPSSKLDVEGNISVNGTEGFNAAGEDAIVSFGHPAHNIRAEHGTGVVISAFAAADALTIRENSGNVGIGTTNPGGRLDVQGGTIKLGVSGQADVLDAYSTNIYLKAPNGSILFQTPDGQNRMEIQSDGNVGIGTTSPETPLDVVGEIRSIGQNGKDNVCITSLSMHPNRGYVQVCDENGSNRVGMLINWDGQGQVYGDIKSFRVANPDRSGTEICYTCIEGPEAAAYVRGTAHLIDGRAVVALPDHFNNVASPGGMTVQLTPLSAKSKGLAAVKKSPGELIVEELGSGTGTYYFDYLVMAVRRGHEDYQVIRPAMVTQR